MRDLTFLLTVIMLLAGCAGRMPTEPPPASQTLEPESDSAEMAPDSQAQQEMDALVATLMASPAPLRATLLAQHAEWKGVPYRYGGMSQRGVDCSGFVHLTFRSRLGMEVPRTTAELLQAGNPVKRNHLQVGDLVFFRTGPGNRHVGIYLGKGDFLHASTSRGVITSSLANPYWASRYWQARRLVNP